MIVDLKTFPNLTDVAAAFYDESGSLVDTVGLNSSLSSGSYRFTVTLDDGYYDYKIISDNNVMSLGAIHVAEGAVVLEADTILQLKSAQGIEDAIGAISETGSVTVVSPVDTTGKISGAIVIGDDYLAANNRAFAWTIPAIAGVTPGTATAKFGGAKEDESWLVTGTITVDGGNWDLSFDLPRTATEELSEGHYAWSVKVYSVSGTEITRVRSDKHLVQLVQGQA